MEVSADVEPFVWGKTPPPCLLLFCKDFYKCLVVVIFCAGGKSAILTALIVALGGNAQATNRGSSLKGFVKEGER